MQVFYQCQRCGNCCRWPGQVTLKESDLDRLAEYLNMPVLEFTKRYTDLHPSRQCLILKNKVTHECVFLDGKNHCVVNQVKPHQCSGFPNTWNFLGWRDMCESIPVEAIKKA
ncbi:MAG: YkgJ family cysteine cluster protein [Verrucomicrobiota bacterium]